MNPNSYFKKWILPISIAIPIVVTILILLPIRPSVNFNIHLLPLFHAILNSATSIALLFSLYFICNKNILWHKRMNICALVLSSLFLISYVVYHLCAETTKYGDFNHDGRVDIAEKLAAGKIRLLYYVLLLTHILLAIVVIPFVLYSFLYALSFQLEKHKKLSKYTWAIWFYVAVTGVIVYCMIQPFY